MKKLFILLVLVMVAMGLWAQKTQSDINSFVTIQRGTEFNTAIKIIETLSYQYDSKKIINNSSYKGTIPLPINQMYWKDALDLLCKTLNLNLEDKAGVFTIIDPPTTEKLKVDLAPTERQVRISAIFFRADKNFLNSIGIDWSTIVNGKVSATVGFKGATKVTDDLFSAKSSYSISNNGYVIDLNTLLKTVESDQKGSVIAKPNISVLSGKEGYIQVGQDFSVKTIDDAGNIADKFFSTGIILKVKPTVIQYGDKEVVHLVANVEKSSATPGQISTIINKNQANTEVYLYNGEETVIGGLYDTDYTTSRVGIPFLKDLPWWVLGIRYLTGVNKVEQNSREMIVILKTDIIDSIEKRLEKSQELKDKIEEIRNNNQKSDFMMEEKKLDQDLKQ